MNHRTLRDIISSVLLAVFMLTLASPAFAACTMNPQSPSITWTGNLCVLDGTWSESGSQEIVENNNGSQSSQILNLHSTTGLSCNTLNPDHYGYDNPVSVGNTQDDGMDSPYYTYIKQFFVLGFYPKVTFTFTSLASDYVTGCYRQYGSPILISFQPKTELTSAADGVNFDLQDYGPTLKQRIAWTPAESNIGWLVRGTNVTGVTQLFGDRNTQAPPLTLNEPENGYRALRLFDSTADGKISASDPVWYELNVWFDRNHNGISEADELVPLASAGVESIDLGYAKIGKKDQNGNLFRFRSKVQLSDGSSAFSFDVFPNIEGKAR